MEALAKWLGAEMRAANSELASTLRASILGLARRNAYRDTAAERDLRALAHTHVEQVNADAAEIDDQAREAGLFAERFWKDHGLADTFPEGPWQMIRVALESWRQNRDAIEGLRKENAAMNRTIIGLREQFDSALQRERAYHRVWRFMALAAASGVRIDKQVVAFLFFMADKAAEPLSVFSYGSSTVDFRRKSSYGMAPDRAARRVNGGSLASQAPRESL